MIDTSSDIKYIQMARTIVLNDISDEDVSIFLFGSRVTKKENGSDIDVGLLSDNKVDQAVLRKVRDDLEESRIPYSVDLVDFFDVEKKFKKIALEKIEIWRKGKYLTRN